VRYSGKIYRPPSEAASYILQATIGCSWNQCVYCDMYRAKQFRVRPVSECLQDLQVAGEIHGDRVEKIFVADGDALMMEMAQWAAILKGAKTAFPLLRQVSCYATAENVAEKSDAELRELRDMGLKVLYIGPESGDETTLRKIAKGQRPAGAARDEPYMFDTHVEAGQRAKAAGMKVSAIFLLGVGGVANSERHAEGSARLITGMDPAFLAALTLTIVPGTPLAKTAARTGFQLPDQMGLMTELRQLVDLSRPTNALFRTNHASNYLPLGGRLPVDRQRIVETIDAALAGKVPLRPEWMRGL
jgi:radical SAM superfamily enzyme YgiQ (UPF0313 family)